MIHRPVDESGDALPALASSAVLKGIRAEIQLVNDRLNLLSGDWWENPAWGNAALEMLKGSRLTEADQRAMASYITSFIRETPGVQDVRDVSYSVEGRQFRFACTIETENGTASVEYVL